MSPYSSKLADTASRPAERSRWRTWNRAGPLTPGGFGFVAARDAGPVVWRTAPRPGGRTAAAGRRARSSRTYLLASTRRTRRRTSRRTLPRHQRHDHRRHDAPDLHRRPFVRDDVGVDGGVVGERGFQPSSSRPVSTTGGRPIRHPRPPRRCDRAPAGSRDPPAARRRHRSRRLHDGARCPHHERGIRVPISASFRSMRFLTVESAPRRAEAGSRAAGPRVRAEGSLPPTAAPSGMAHRSRTFIQFILSRRPCTRDQLQTFRAPTRMESFPDQQGAPLMGPRFWSGSTRDGRSPHVVSDISRHTLGHAVRLRSIRWFDGRRSCGNRP